MKMKFCQMLSKCVTLKVEFLPPLVYSLKMKIKLNSKSALSVSQMVLPSPSTTLVAAVYEPVTTSIAVRDLYNHPVPTVDI